MLIYASMYENRKKFRIIQEVLAFLLIVTGSQIRFAPFEAVGAVFFALAVGVVLASILKNRKGKGTKKAVLLTIKKYFKTGILIVLAVIIAVSAEAASNAIKQKSESYNKMNEYYTALSAINDYDDTSFFMDKEFYQSIGIKSISDYSVLRHWFIDEDFFTVEKLRAIAENSRKNNTLSNEKGVFESVFNPISTAFSDAWNSGIIIIVAFALIIFIFTIAVLCIFLENSRAALLRFGSFVLLWSFFFIISKGFNIESMLALPLAFLTIYISFRFDNFMYIKTLAIICVVLVLYCYMTTMRLYLHVTAALLLPAFVFLIVGLGKDVPLTFVKKKKLCGAVQVITAGVLIICSIISAQMIYNDQIPVHNAASNKALKQYIADNPDKVFMIDQTCMARDYYEPFVLSEEPTNIANYGLWVGKSGYIKNTRERNGINHVFKDSINSNILIPVFNNNTGKSIIGANNIIEPLEEYYNERYAQKGEIIRVEKYDKAGKYLLYKIVSNKKK